MLAWDRGRRRARAPLAGSAGRLERRDVIRVRFGQKKNTFRGRLSYRRHERGRSTALQTLGLAANFVRHSVPLPRGAEFLDNVLMKLCPDGRLPRPHPCNIVLQSGARTGP